MYVELKRRCVMGEWAAGTRISVERIRADYGVSKQPVMEAIRLMSAEGLVDIVPQVGCIVSAYLPSDVLDFYRLFAATEGTVAETAASRRTEEDLAALNVELQGTGRYVDTPATSAEITSYRQANRAFHATLARATHSPLMVRESARQWDFSDFLVNTTQAQLAECPGIAGRHNDHIHLVDAILDKNTDRARGLASRHVEALVVLVHGEMLS